jgi:hypothetical protein
MKTVRGCLAGGALFAAVASAQDAPVDSLSPVFRPDSAKASAIRSIETGKASTDSARTAANQVSDSLALKLRRRGPFIALSAGAAFADHSAKQLFIDYMNSQMAADSQRVLQDQDPVHVYFPVGLVVGYPVFTYLDVWLRTEHFWYRVKGLAQKGNESPREFWYANQAHLAGAGARYLVPVSFLSVNGKPGLYVAYTHFWNFGPTGLYSPTGSLRARTNPAGAGYEIQAGLQQDFDKRFTFSGGLAFTRLSFESKANWNTVLPGGPATQAEWTIQSMRFALQGLYQFGR